MTDNGSVSVDIWQVSMTLPNTEAVEAFEEALEDTTTGLSSFRINKTPSWYVTGYIAGEPSRIDILNRMRAAASKTNIAMPDFDISLVEEIDWVAKVERELTPITVDPYFIFGSHIEKAPPKGAVAIKIDAGQAFGTGHHETTCGCLQAIETLCAQRPPSNPLDLGTGSGILAIAIAKRLGISVTASDNDPIAIEVARENARLNGVREQIDLHVGEGIGAASLIEKAPYDLIVANILANPLVALSPEISGALTESGHAILSGILLDQAEAITITYLKNGLKLQQLIEVGDWVTLMLASN